MATTTTTSGRGAVRGGSAEKQAGHTVIPHTRLEDEAQLEQIYDIGGPLGEGSFGIVREVTHRATGGRWACKAINKEKAGGSKVKLLEREVTILKKVRQEHIICLREVFETSQKMYLVMELCDGGELSKELRRQGRFPEDKVKVIMARLASAIAYLHKYDMVHRDLKLENILLSKNPEESSDNLYIKVTDFGLSVVKGGVGHDNMMMDFCGTPMYMSPEIIDNKTYGQLCDVWAMGVIMYSLISGSSPYSETSSDEELYDMIKKMNIQKVIDANMHWKKVSAEGKALLCRMMTVDPAHRSSASEVCDDPWITGKSPTQGPRNVLEMMRDWGRNLDDSEAEDDDGGLVMNGRQGNDERTTPEAEDEAQPRVELRNSSANNNRRGGKNSGGAQRASVSGTPSAPAKSKRLTRNSTDPNLQQTAAKYGSKVSTPLRSTISKSKSPIDRDRLVFSTAKSKGHHAAKPLATKTTTSSNQASTSNNNASSSTPRGNDTAKPRKKISR